MKRCVAWSVLVGCVTLAPVVQGQPRRPRDGGPDVESNGRMPTLAFRTEVPAHPYDLLLARPTANSVTLSLLAYQRFRAAVFCGETHGELKAALPVREFKEGQPAVLLLNNLKPNTRYAYELRPAPTEAAAVPGTGGTFFTARAPGATFTFCVQADSHLDFGTDTEVYQKSLANAQATESDFQIDLGDTFMTDKRNNYRDALPQYLAQRYYFGTQSRAVPLLLVLGNHDGESPSKGAGEAMAVWANGMRKEYFPNPEPDGFYSGNSTPHPRAGPLEDFYAFEWGDALFVALDPYWFSNERDRDNWGRSLGRTQYDWLARTLATSHARFTFVFVHNLVGGETREGRGGAEASQFFEWGGRDLDGRDTFAQHRPGWPSPIHELLARRGGVVVFHGHDHFYARQERDGVIYQLVPQPGHQRADNQPGTEDYGYKSGVIQGASGILRVTVARDRALVEYVRSYPAAAENGRRKTGAVTHSYSVSPQADAAR